VNTVNIVSFRKGTHYHHGNLRAALVEAALQAVAEVGPDRFTLRDVARRANVSVAAPYRHFADKEALLKAVADECAVQLGAAMHKAVAEAGSDPIARFRATGIAYVRFAVEHPAHFRAISKPGVAARVPPAMIAFQADERDRLLAAQKAGLIADLPLDDVMLAAMSLTHGLASFMVDGAEGLAGLTPATAERIALAVTQVFGVGLLPR
jgi:AcrR family transcriptional regulator